MDVDPPSPSSPSIDWCMSFSTNNQQPTANNCCSSLARTHLTGSNKLLGHDSLSVDVLHSIGFDLSTDGHSDYHFGFHIRCTVVKWRDFSNIDIHFIRLLLQIGMKCQLLSLLFRIWEFLNVSEINILHLVFHLVDISFEYELKFNLERANINRNKLNSIQFYRL